MTIETQEFASALNEAKQNVLEAIKSDNRNVFVIGKALNDAKAAAQQTAKADVDLGKYQYSLYRRMYDDLHFDEKTGDKFIRIYACKYLRELQENEATTGNLITSYTSLYELTHSDIASDTKRIAKIQKIFTDGEVQIEGTMKKSIKLTLKDIRSVLGINKKSDTKSESKVSDTKDVDRDFTNIHKVLHRVTDSFVDDVIERLSDAEEHIIEGFISDFYALTRKYEIGVVQEQIDAAE